MAYTYNIINNNQPNFEELDEFVIRTIAQVVLGSATGDLGNTAKVDQAFSESNLQTLGNTQGISTLISVTRDGQNQANLDFSLDNSYTHPFWGFAYDIYIRIDANRNDQAKLERILRELINGLCLNIQKDGSGNDVPYSNLLATADGWSNTTYYTFLDRNKQLGQPLIVKEPFGTNITYYTAVLTILFRIYK
jgi:hypothetical protein